MKLSEREAEIVRRWNNGEPANLIHEQTGISLVSIKSVLSTARGKGFYVRRVLQYTRPRRIWRGTKPEPLSTMIARIRMEEGGA